MQVRTITQDLQGSQLIKIFLNFVQTYRLQYQKIHKEISYKCFEATWILNIAKGSGYGRTETEAYKNALKNLLEFLICDTRYAEYFSTALPKISKPKQENRLSPTMKWQIKTEGNDLAYEANQNDNLAVKDSKNRLATQSSKKHFYLNGSEMQNSELQVAKGKMRLLQAKLALVQEENRILREKLVTQEQDNKFQMKVSKNLSKQQSVKSFHNKEHFREENDQKSAKINHLMTAKLNIPKLNLNVLPNYHKKSEKCLNDALLQAYNEKHGATAKIIL